MTTKRTYLHFHALAYALRRSNDAERARRYATWYLHAYPDGELGHVEAFPYWEANIEFKVLTDAKIAEQDPGA